MPNRQDTRLCDLDLSHGDFPFPTARGNEHNILTESAATKRSHQKREDETIGRWYRRYLGPDQLIHAHDQPAGRALISRQRGQSGGTRLPALPACAPEYRGSIWTDVPLTGMADALFLIQGGERTARSAARRGTRWYSRRAANQYQSLMDTLAWSGASS
jgi:hypothetical protein